MTTITTEVFLKMHCDDAHSQQRFLDAKQKGDLEAMAEAGYISQYRDSEGCMVVATGTATLEMLDDADITRNAIESLTEQKAKILAEASAKATSIEGQIQSLLAISYDAQPA